MFERMDEKRERYTQYINNKYPKLKISKMQCSFKDEKHSDTVTLNNVHVFKFAKYDWSASFIDNEVNTVNLIRRYINMPLPKMQCLETGITISNYIEGEPLFRNVLLLLDNRAQEAIAEEIGTFMKQLHGISIYEEGIKNINESPVDFSADYWMSQYEGIQRKLYPHCDSYTKKCIYQVFKPLMDNGHFLDYKASIIHGNPVPNNFLFDKGSNRINGVINFGLSGTGDPAYDIGVLIDNLGETFVKRVSRYYKDIDSFIDRSRFYAFTIGFCWGKSVADMITTRDFTHFKFFSGGGDKFPIGSNW
ncbi:aminoglycoside 2''-phosphotransferase [Ruminiclostridium sufflavum DSM 19573]|uniref:Aminoglycoside 2''-phosphotransferase n=1 Tax=Ruminiclostridium sufflavum DSM 19573 TaxID=1121337 RepID=A0A318XT69_9FIRM|nr:aminoglycoside phosphotransferase family protein [Ruminiclostridium sufflavum]PYG84994.1 aminoglycoside 2''-phosphotransferase [Ruminiclostridium sufflavum DSM 19573]